jgi:hypothetical protein
VAAEMPFVRQAFTFKKMTSLRVCFGIGKDVSTHCLFATCFYKRTLWVLMHGTPCLGANQSSSP